MHHEYLIDDIIFYSILFNKWFDSNDIGYIIFDKSHILFIYGNCWLIVNLYSTAIALYCPLFSIIGDIFNQVLISEQVHCVTVV